jgi:hypothetical protein
MKTAPRVFEQGELTFIRLDGLTADQLADLALPAETVEGELLDGRPIVGHSETGHHHVISDFIGTWRESTNPFIAYLSMEQPGMLEHLRRSDTHDTWSMPAGRYRVSRQAEEGPEGWRRVED